mmetsp:Transcript_5908/g.10285  ORF Transcript_5908/g.10285 Transcript_5908/m.10285 type:complete len:114 (-) Transcript_5908:3-344(-)
MTRSVVCGEEPVAVSTQAKHGDCTCLFSLLRVQQNLSSWQTNLLTQHVCEEWFSTRQDPWTPVCDLESAHLHQNQWHHQNQWQHQWQQSVAPSEAVATIQQASGPRPAGTQRM